MKILLFVSLITISINASPQELLPFTGRAVFGEALGGAWRGSLNVEQFLFNKGRWTGFARAGVEYIPSYDVGKDRLESYQGGLSLSKWLGSHHAEVGLGILYRRANANAEWYERDVTDEVLFVPSIGYRYQSPGGGLFFRATIPVLRLVKDYYITMYEAPRAEWSVNAGVSVGYFISRNKESPEFRRERSP